MSTTHTVNVVYRAEPAEPTPELELDAQHDGTKFATEPREQFHEYVNEYLRDADYDTSD